MSNEYILEMKDITMLFPGVRALSEVTFKVRKGTVHGLMGENGAGKSTLMKVLQGIYQPTSGSMVFNGQPMMLRSINQAIKAGISMIQQEMSPIPDMTVAENIYLGREPRSRFGFVNHRKLNQQTQQLLDDLGLAIAPETLMRTLSVANMQMIEIAKAISFNSKLIVMDEPTSAITESEVERLFSIIAKLKDRDVTVIYITHKMAEVFAITDEITVLRDGQFVGCDLSSNLNQDKLIHLMVGRELKEMFPKVYQPVGEEVLRVENLSDGERFHNISFKVHAGEILGIAGLMGAGRSEVIEAVFGLRPTTGGQIFLHGKEVKFRNAQDAIANGVGFLTEDRKKTGCFLPLDITDNMIMSNLKLQKSVGPMLSTGKIHERTEDMRKKLNVRTPSMSQNIVFLSGGNQQKVLIARWMLNNPDVLIVDEPTRGIDVNAKAEIHRLLGKMTSEGKAVIMISSEMPEIIGMSDRIMVMHEGRIVGEVHHSEATQERVMECIFAGAAQNDSRSDENA